jgi:RimJ/RimL family protein N-acetyltransferase
MLIETERCRIRRFKEGDLEAFMDYRNNSEWMKYQGFKNRTREEYAAFLLGKRNVITGMQLALAEKESDSLIGDIYLKYDGEVYTLGYTLHPGYSGKGYMTEALRALIKQLNSEIHAGVLPENEASKKLLKRLGFTYSYFDEAEGEEVYIY